MSDFTPLTGSGASDVYVTGDEFGYQTVEKIRGNFNNHEERIVDLEDSGAGDVVGAASSTDNAIVRMDGTGGKTIQSSGITVADGASGTLAGTNSGDVTLAGSPNYLTLAAQVITRALIDLTSHVTGRLPFANLVAATGASKLLGRGSASGGGNVEEVTLGSGLTMTGTVLSASSGSGDVTGQALSVDSEVALFSSTTGKVIKRATGTGIVRVTSGVYGTPGPVSLSSEVTGTLAASSLGTTGAPQFARIGVGQTADANAAAVFTGQIVTTEYDAGNSSTAITIDWNNGNQQTVAMTGNCTFTFSNPKAGARYLLILIQDGTGSRTATWPATVKWTGGTTPTLSTGTNKVDIATFAYTSKKSGIYIAAANLDIGAY